MKTFFFTWFSVRESASLSLLHVKVRIVAQTRGSPHLLVCPPQLVDFKIQRFCLLVYPFHFVTGPVFDNVSLFTAVLFMHTDEHWGYTLSVCLWRWGNLATRKLEKEKKSSLFFIYRVKYIVWIIWIWDIPTSSSVCILYSARNQQLNCKRVQSQQVVVFKENNKTNTSQRYNTLCWVLL